jgi:serralysin
MADIPGSTATTATLTLGTSRLNQIEVASDQDWFRLELTAGQTVRISLSGASGGLAGSTALEDTFLRLRGSSGSILLEDDDSGPGLFSAITYTATTTGTFFVDASAFGTNTGGYSLLAQLVTPPGPVDSVKPGDIQPNNTVTYYFGQAGENFDGEVTGEAWNAYEISRMKAGMALIAQFVNLTFVEVDNPDDADFRLQLDLNQTDALGYFYLPGSGPNTGVGVFGGDTWDRTAGGDLENGGFSFVTIIHEMLHGLGLEHPHDGAVIMSGVTSEFDDFGDFNLNQGIFTTMSYNSGYFTGTPGSQGAANELYGYEFGPMALDIAALQDAYGANMATRAADTNYVLPKVNAQGTFWRSIWDGGGIDTITNAGGSGNAVIDLRAATLRYEAGGGGFVSAVNGIAGGFTIANGVVIENAIGGSGRDRLVGNSAANTLDGGAGNDTMLGAAGNDTYRVRDADDIVAEAVNRGTDTVTASTSWVLTAGAHVERLATNGSSGTVSINLTGNAISQTVTGNAGDNRLDGGAGNDVLTGLGGDDVFRFTAALMSTNVDRISDYVVADDRIQIDNAVFTTLTTGTLAASAYRANTAGQATDSSDRIIYDTDDGILYFDRDGSGATYGRVRFAFLDDGLSLSASEFLVI